MKGAFLFGEGWSRHFHFCSAQKEERGSSFAHKQLKSVRVPLRRATGKNTPVFAVSCAMQGMSCFELVSLMGDAPNAWCGTTHRCHSSRAPGLEPWGVVTSCGSPALLVEEQDSRSFFAFYML
jgi:hypothetical protein